MEGLQVIKVNNQDLPIMTFNGQRVVTFKDIDRVHERPKGTAKKNFSNNRKHFIENEDYYIIKQKYVGEDFTLTYGFDKKAPSGTLLTEMGYLMVVKSFNDSLAWKVQRQLVNGYFKMKELATRPIQPIQQQQQSQSYTLNTHMRAEILSMIDNKLEERLNIRNESLKSGQEVITQHFNHTIEATTRQYIDMSPKPITDPIRDAIVTLAELTNDNSHHYNMTYRKVYEAMGCNWQYRKTRYRNRNGHKKDPSKIKLIEGDKKLLKLFIDTVNQMKYLRDFEEMTKNI